MYRFRVPNISRQTRHKCNQTSGFGFFLHAGLVYQASVVGGISVALGSNRKHCLQRDR